MADEKKPLSGDALVGALGDIFHRFLSSLGEATSLPKEAKEFLESRAPLIPKKAATEPKGAQAQVRGADEAMRDQYSRTANDRDFGSAPPQPTPTEQVQAHIDHINARAIHAAELLKSGKPLKGTGYETAQEDFDRWFGEGAFQKYVMEDRNDYADSHKTGK